MLKKLAYLALALVILAALNWFLPQRVNPYIYHTILMAGINIILAVSLNIVNGFTGQFSIGHAGFMAVGAYTAGVMTTYVAQKFTAVPMTVMFVVALVAGAVAAALAGVLIGLPSLRLRGDYLAVATLGFGQIVVVLIWNNFFNLIDIGGAAGYSGLPLQTNFFWVFLTVLTVIVVSRNLVTSVHGRALLTIREDEVAAEAIGIDTTTYKVIAFVLGSAFAGVAGGLEGHLDLTINANSYTFMRSIAIVVMVVLGGMGSITGCVIAATVLTVLTELLRNANAVAALMYVMIVAGAWLSHQRFKPRGPRLALHRIFHVALLCVLTYMLLRHRDFFAQQVEQLRMVIYSLLLILLMLTRPGGLFGRNELSLETFRALGRRFRHAPA